MKTQKLLNKTLHYYLALGGLMVLLAVPSYYIFHNQYYTHEIDEFLLDRKKTVFQKNLNALKISEIALWNQYNDDEKIIADNGQTAENAFVTENFRGDADEDYRVLYSKIKIENADYILIIPISTFEAKKIIKSGAAIQLAFFLVLLLGFAFITHLAYKNLWTPFYQTLTDIQRFNIRNNEIPVFSKTDIKEFQQLNAAVENLIFNNLQAYKIQKEFTENASHEMQTPLAVFRSRLDILLQQDLTKRQFQTLQTLDDAVSRLTRMNKNLLLLAKIDNLQFPETQVLNIVEILNKTLPFIEEQSHIQHIEIQADIKENIIVRSNKALLESLLGNLLVNAVKHNIQNGKISISLNNNQLIISNTGIEKSLNGAMLFRRFGRMSETASGSGLGLAIAKQICLLYGWKINYFYNSSEHCFSVEF